MNDKKSKKDRQDEENYLKLKQEVLNLIMEDIAKDDEILSISDDVLDKIIEIISSEKDEEISSLKHVIEYLKNEINSWKDIAEAK